MNGAPEHVWDFVKPLPGSLREKWDENVTTFEVLQSFTDVSVFRCCSPRAMTCLSPVEGTQTPFGKGSALQTPGAQAQAGTQLREGDTPQTELRAVQGEREPRGYGRSAWISPVRPSLKSCPLMGP